MLVALVEEGPLTALIMLAGVVAVQQLQAHVLQPFVLGNLLAVHLGIVLGDTAGVLLVGVVGALVAGPLAAVVNAVVVHLADTRSGLAADRRPSSN